MVSIGELFFRDQKSDQDHDHDQDILLKFNAHTMFYVLKKLIKFGFDPQTFFLDQEPNYDRDQESD